MNDANTPWRMPQTLKMKVAHRLGSRLYSTAAVELTQDFQETVKCAVMAEKYPHFGDAAAGFDFKDRVLKDFQVTHALVTELRKFC